MHPLMAVLLTVNFQIDSSCLLLVLRLFVICSGGCQISPASFYLSGKVKRVSKPIDTKQKPLSTRFGPEAIIDTTDDYTRLALDTLAYCSMSYRWNAFASTEFNCTNQPTCHSLNSFYTVRSLRYHSSTIHTNYYCPCLAGNSATIRPSDDRLPQRMFCPIQPANCRTGSHDRCNGEILGGHKIHDRSCQQECVV